MKKYRVIVEETGKSKPRDHELEIAEKLTAYFESDIIFIRRAQSKTPDLYITKTNTRWELKSPIGGGKHTIKNNLRDIEYQSENVILDLSRAKLTDEKGISRAKEFLRTKHCGIKRLKIFTKSGDMIDIK